MKSKEYKEGISHQKDLGWFLIVCGGILTLSLIGAIIGIPMIVIGIVIIKSKEVNAITGVMVKNRIKK